MKAVLMSVQPKYCELIASGKKTIEVRKTAPKSQTPFKCYIYCTLSGCKQFAQDDLLRWGKGKWYEKKGKVIGEFVCDGFEEFQIEGAAGVMFKRFSALSKTCLTVSEMREYAGHKSKLYGWLISELKIYDTPKELGEFRKPCSSAPTSLCYPDNCERCPWNAITRPPQSWCYVEEINE